MKPRLPIPTGLRHSAQGCRVGEAALGHLVDYFPQPQRGCITVRAHGFNPVGVGFPFPGSPRVARASQPWAGCRSPVGANELGFRFRSSGFGTRPSFGPRISGFGFGPLRPRVGAAVQIRPCKGASRARHAECCILAYDDLAYLLGLHLLGLLSGIFERRGPPSAVHGRPNDARERNCFDARYCCCVGECEDGVPIC